VNSVEWTESGNFFIKRVAEFFIRKKEEKEGKKREKGEKKWRRGKKARKGSERDGDFQCNNYCSKFRKAYNRHYLSWCSRLGPLSLAIYSWPNLRHFNAPGFDFVPCELQLSTTVLLKPRQPEHKRNFVGKRHLVSLLGYFTLALAAGGPAAQQAPYHCCLPRQLLHLR